VTGRCVGCNLPLEKYSIGYRDCSGFRWYHQRCAPAVTR
jgi:hypothetical protein